MPWATGESGSAGGQTSAVRGRAEGAGTPRGHGRRIEGMRRLALALTGWSPEGLVGSGAACMLSSGLALTSFASQVCASFSSTATPPHHADTSSQTKQHGASQLTAACMSSAAREHADVRAALLAYVRARVPQARSACLAGNTVHADAAFLKGEMPEVSGAGDGE